MFYKALFSLLMGVPRFIRVWAKKAVSAAGVRALFSLFPKSGKRGFLYGEFGRALIQSHDSVEAVSTVRHFFDFINL